MPTSLGAHAVENAGQVVAANYLSRTIAIASCVALSTIAKHFNVRSKATRSNKQSTEH